MEPTTPPTASADATRILADPILPTSTPPHGNFLRKNLGILALLIVVAVGYYLLQLHLRLSKPNMVQTAATTSAEIVGDGPRTYKDAYSGATLTYPANFTFTYNPSGFWLTKALPTPGLSLYFSFSTLPDQNASSVPKSTKIIFHGKEAYLGEITSCRNMNAACYIKSIGITLPTTAYGEDAVFILYGILMNNQKNPAADPANLKAIFEENMPVFQSILDSISF
jgi:hypothetical protein